MAVYCHQVVKSANGHSVLKKNNKKYLKMDENNTFSLIRAIKIAFPFFILQDTRLTIRFYER